MYTSDSQNIIIKLVDDRILQKEREHYMIWYGIIILRKYGFFLLEGQGYDDNDR